MHPAIRVSTEIVRGCGWRSLGGLYLTSDGKAISCGRLPIPLTQCPCCGNAAVARPARGWTWVDADRLLENAPDCVAPKKVCSKCPLSEDIARGMGRAGLLWVGESFYGNPAIFEDEARKMGVSRRIQAVPHGFIVGKHFVLLAHRKAVMWTPPKMGQQPKFAPGIFRIWKPSKVEVIVSGDESNDEIDALVKRGLSPVKVIRKAPVQGRME